MPLSTSPKHIETLAQHPQAQKITGASGIEYVSVPQGLVSPDAKPLPCPVTGSARYQDTLVMPAAFTFNAPYEG